MGCCNRSPKGGSNDLALLAKCVAGIGIGLFVLALLIG